MSAHLINDHIGPLLEGENAMATEKLYDMMMRITSRYSPSDLASYAISAVDRWNYMREKRAGMAKMG